MEDKDIERGFDTLEQKISKLEKELKRLTTTVVYDNDGRHKVVPLVTVFEDFMKSYAVKPVEVPEHIEFREDCEWGGGY